MKNVKFIIALLVSPYFYGQVGVNTENPKTTLEVRETRNQNTTNNGIADGIIIPKLTASELANKTVTTYQGRITSGTNGLNSHEGTLVFIVADPGGSVIIPTSGPSISKVSEVTQEGLYYYGADDKWHFAGDYNLWTKDPNNTAIKLAKTSLGTARTTNTEIIINDSGNVGIGLGNNNPTKRLDINAATENNPTDVLRIQNLKATDNSVSVRNLVIDSDGYVTRNKYPSVEGQIMRVPVFSEENNYVVWPINTQSDVLFYKNPPYNAPNNTPNLINEIVGASIETGTPQSSIIKLPEGLYKVELKIIGNFTAANANNSLNVAALVNGQEYSSQNFGTNTFTPEAGRNYITGFIYTDIINLDDGDDNTNNLSEISFKATSLTNPFKVVGGVNFGSPVTYVSYRSVLLIERLK